ncbi:L-Aspartase-like protein [Dunaliella salina]|uniref:L-Aspartase-like protein n=1 Tax=Dunaliella salina TaxID=3046 RepID=A0ABQ7GZ37_DUNSA|nr:L-Aspartase-like protein [Dunaliella salina]|eukprot:KAF5839870.1 L-Aspartase-like protein [Dunaliella salina]
MEKFNESLPFDKRMWAEDLKGSQVYARALSKAGILTSEEADVIVEGLKKVATDTRLWLYKELCQIRQALQELISVTSERAERECDVLMPGFTHLQPAMTVRWSHWLMCHAAAFQRDDMRLKDLMPRVATSPLGSGALAGNPFGVDRQFIAQELGMIGGVCPNSMDAVCDRDYVLETVFFASTLLMHLSRWAEDLIIYSSGQFGYVQCSDAYATGSSLMPQKKNPDALELIRGKAGRMQGNLAGVMCVMKGAPTTYNKDFQVGFLAMISHLHPWYLLARSSCPNLFVHSLCPLYHLMLLDPSTYLCGPHAHAPLTGSQQAVGAPSVVGAPSSSDQQAVGPCSLHRQSTGSWCLIFEPLFVHFLAGMAHACIRTFSRLSADMLATDLAEYLVRKGLPFRETHHISGAAVKMAEDRGCALSDLKVDDLKTIHPLFEKDVEQVWDFNRSAETRDTEGGASKRSVLEQVAKMQAYLKSQQV